MKREKKLTALALVLSLILVVTVGCAGSAFAEESSMSVNRFNVVLVVDKSGSLRELDGHGTDPDGLRFDAMKLFLGLLTESGNNVGAIVFDEKIRYDSGLRSMNSMADKKELIASVENFQPSYDTDIGSAVMRATEILKGMKAENGLPCMILLLTDGKTDFSVGDRWAQTRKSYATASKALKAAQDEGIVINGILLNVDGRADGGEIEFNLYTQGTNGSFEQVTRPEDLTGAFRRFYSIINNTEYSGSHSVKFSSDGEASMDFVVPGFGVEEVNVIFEHASASAEDDADADVTPNSMEIFRPDGSVYEIEGHNLDSSHYSFVKIPHPQMGKWSVGLKGSPRDTADITMVFNASMSATLIGVNTEETYRAYEPYTFFVRISDPTVSEITDEQLRSLEAFLEVRNTETGVVRRQEMHVEDGLYVCDYLFDAEGQYEVSALVGLAGFEVRSNALDTKVVLPPLATKTSRVADTLSYGRFHDDCWELALAEIFDASGVGGMRYSLSDDYNGAVAIKDGVLTVHPLGTDRAMFSVTATDMMGRSAEIPFDLTIPGVDTRVSSVWDMFDYGEFDDDGWAMDLGRVFNDPKGGELRYILSDDYAGALSIEDGILRARNVGREHIDFTVRAVDMMGLSAQLPFEFDIPAITAESELVTDMTLPGSFHDDMWEMDLAPLFYDEKGTAPRYSLSDDLGGVLTVEDGVLRMQGRLETDSPSFTLTASDTMGMHAEVPFELTVPTATVSVDSISNMLRYGRFHDNIWETDLKMLYTDPKGTPLTYTLSDDFDGALTISEDGILQMDVQKLREAAFTVTGSDIFGLGKDLPFNVKLPGPSVSISGISETVKTGLFQPGTWSMNIDGVFRDAKGSKLTYTLSDDYNGAVTIDNGVLRANCKGLGTASFNVKATDEYEMSAELPVTLTERNMTWTYLLYALLALLAILIPAVLLVYIFRRR